MSDSDRLYYEKQVRWKRAAAAKVVQIQKFEKALIIHLITKFTG
jgi:hypothetical protein